MDTPYLPGFFFFLLLSFSFLFARLPHHAFVSPLRGQVARERVLFPAPPWCADRNQLEMRGVDSLATASKYCEQRHRSNKIPFLLKRMKEGGKRLIIVEFPHTNL